MPKSNNTFTGKCSLTFEQFEDIKQLVGIARLNIVFTDGKAKCQVIQDWMIESAQIGAKYVLMYHSKNLYLKHKKDQQHFKSKFMTDEAFKRRLEELDRKVSK